MAVPYTFATATSSIPLSQLDANFATGITLGNTTVYLGNTTTSIGNLTLTNATISSVASTFPNSYLANSSVTIGSTNVSLGGTATTITGLTLTGSTFSGTSVTDSGLTSGRVTYATTGGLLTDSANLTWNGSALGITGAVSASGQISGASGAFSTATGSISLTNASYGNILSTNTLYIDTTGGAINIRPAGSTIGTFTTTGLGIGTSSPSSKLSVYTSPMTNQIIVDSMFDATTYGIISLNGNRVSTDYLGIAGGGGADKTLFLNVPSGGKFSFRNSFSEQMQLDNSGNLGLGVTPSAWSGAKVLDIGSRGSLVDWASSQQTDIWSNGYFNGTSSIYKTTATASIYRQAVGQHQWFTAPSSTAGSQITFTQAMTLDNSGNLGIGTSSPTVKLDIIGSSNTSLSPTVRVYSNNVAVNSTLAYDGLVGSGEFTLQTSSTNSLKFGTNSTERMRIDSSGNVLIGQTTVSNAVNGLYFQATGGGSANIVHATGIASGTGYAYFLYAGAVIGSITQSGTTAVLYNVTSDQRLKENIVNAPSGNIDDIKVRSFDWIADGSHQEYGMVAQELLEVAPYAVHQPQDTEEMMAVDYSKLVPMMIKEIQDLKAEVNQLKAKVGI